MSDDQLSDDLELDPTDLAVFRSDYLGGGYWQEQIQAKRVRLGKGHIHGTFRVVSDFVPGDGRFHLTVPLAFAAFAQLGIIFAHMDSRYRTEVAEVYIREFNLRFRRRVNELDDIATKLELLARREAESGTYYRGSVDVQGKSFVGTASFLLPRQWPSAVRSAEMGLPVSVRQLEGLARRRDRNSCRESAGLTVRQQSTGIRWSDRRPVRPN